MLTRRFVLAHIGIALLVAAPARAQDIVVAGPPPELRAHLAAFIKAFNADGGDQWEEMAKQVFTPAFLKRQTEAERKQASTKMRDVFGTIAIDHVERDGPDTPLRVFVKGSVASGILWIDLDEASRFDSLKPEVRQELDKDPCL
jgi:hypothetical protein